MPLASRSSVVVKVLAGSAVETKTVPSINSRIHTYVFALLVVVIEPSLYRFVVI